MGKRRLVVVDLDGTLVKGNTLHQYVRIGVSEAYRHHRYLNVIKLLGIGALRTLGIISHTEFKFRSLARISIDKELQRKFKEHIASMKNQDVERIIGKMRAEGMTILLATAAADIYVPWIWDGVYVATDTSGKIEMRGERKLKEVKKFMEANDLELHAVITDHYDDLPLLRAGAERNILVNPSLKTLKQCDMDYEII